MIQDRAGVREINIHGMTAGDAKRRLEQFLTKLPSGVSEVVVIHGYNGGKILQEMVRRRLKHPRVRAKLLSLNPGETHLLIKDAPERPRHCNRVNE
ncbi:Smr/MutS family protein [Anaeromassilibacillus senegalensis]|uniref:Smr/MutS family protein n=1 Tax=Anaeromassilibacillus senegalensis TaxID=1673717 RepID=UPI00068199BF|nr:Smr/MutS family protein [Anaeromassilibacillus senegalensis]